MHRRLTAIFYGLLLGSSPAFAAVSIEEETLQFPDGSSRITVQGTLRGYQIVDYLLQAKTGQALSLQFEADNPGAYFNLLPPDSESALFIGSRDGHGYAGQLPQDGQYRIRTYLFRSAARRKEHASYTLAIDLKPRTTEQAATGFRKSLALLGIRFELSSTDQGSLNQLDIRPSGLARDNTPINREIDGRVTAAEVADLNADGAPEIYVYVTSAGSGSYASLVAYAANANQSLSEIYLPPLSDTPSLASGYMGHDEWRTLDNRLLRRFPLYRAGDSNATPSGGTREIQYTLVAGEAGWQLKVDRVVEH